MTEEALGTMIAIRIERRELMALSDREERIGALFDHSYPPLKGLAYVMLVRGCGTWTMAANGISAEEAHRVAESLRPR